MTLTMIQEMNSVKPPVCREGKVVFVGALFPPQTGGSVTVMQELLRQFALDSYYVVTIKAFGKSNCEDFESRCVRLGMRQIRPYNLGMWIRLLQVPFLVSKACRFVRKVQASRLVCIYPTIDFLLLGYLMARKLNIPLSLYLHDTIAEALSKSTFAGVSRLIQKCAFAKAYKIMVMSDGMKDLYKKKYGLDTIAIPHVYPETITNVSSLMPFFTKQLFWGGAVYGINNKALKRVLAASKGMEVGFTFTGRSKGDLLKSLGEAEESKAVRMVYYETRGEYLTALKDNGIMVLALNWPDEAAFGEEEQATIFPTKTPEYLASGAPIIVHCPKEYFLAKFFTEHKCGFVVSERDSAAVKRCLEHILANPPDVMAVRENALKAARIFSPESIAPNFSETITQI